MARREHLPLGAKLRLIGVRQLQLGQLRQRDDQETRSGICDWDLPLLALIPLLRHLLLLDVVVVVIYHLVSIVEIGVLGEVATHD